MHKRLKFTNAMISLNVFEQTYGGELFPGSSAIPDVATFASEVCELLKRGCAEYPWRRLFQGLSGRVRTGVCYIADFSAKDIARHCGRMWREGRQYSLACGYHQ